MLRHIYMPGLLRALTELEEEFADGYNDDVVAENIPLWLPSALPTSKRAAACIDKLPSMEEQLRTAQCNDALDDIRHTLRVKTRMLLFKYANVTGQRDGVKSRTVINGIHDRAKTFAETYRVARTAKLALSGPGEWENQLRVLNDADVQSYVDPERVRKGPGRLGTMEDDVDDGVEVVPAVPSANGDEINLVGKDRRELGMRREHGTGQTRLQLSWIWLTSTIKTGDDMDENDEILREVWAKSRARADRAKEEVLLVREEMKRTLRFLEWKAGWWSEGKTLRTIQDAALREGVGAYARKQEWIQKELSRAFQEKWSVPLDSQGPDLSGDTEGMREKNIAEEEDEDEGDWGEDEDDTENEDEEENIGAGSLA